MKICDLTQFYSPVSGGVRRYIEQKVAYMRRHLPDSRHVLIVPGEQTEMSEDGLSRVYRIRGPLVSRTSRYRILLELGVVEEILEREKPDLIESGDPYQVAWKAVISGRALGIPVVGFYHSHFPEAYIRSVARYFGKIAVQIALELSQIYVRSLYNRFERTLVPSPGLADLLGTWGVENTEKTDLGVDVEIFSPGADDREATRSELGIPHGRTLLLFVGRLAHEKNVRTLIRAFELLAAGSGQFHLLAIGDGPLRGKLKRLIERTGKVTWLPYCSSSPKLASYYRASDLFVHPGLQETFGLVTLESQACGTSVIGIRGSHMDRIIFTPQEHWATENSPDALALAIQRECAGDLVTAGAEASRKVRADYSWDAVFHRLFGIYDKVRAEYSA